MKFLVLCIVALVVLPSAMFWVRSSAAAPVEAGQTYDVRPTTALPFSEAETEPVRCTVNPAELLRCQTACNAGAAEILAFCRSLQDPRIRGTCWALEMVSQVACRGWCYNQFGR